MATSAAKASSLVLHTMTSDFGSAAASSYGGIPFEFVPHPPKLVCRTLLIPATKRRFFGQVPAVVIFKMLQLSIDR